MLFYAKVAEDNIWCLAKSLISLDTFSTGSVIKVAMHCTMHMYLIVTSDVFITQDSAKL